MADIDEQLILILTEVAKKLKNEPQADLKQLVAYLKDVLSQSSQLASAASRMIQINQDDAKSFQTQVEGGIAQVGVHFHVDKDTLKNVLDTFITEQKPTPVGIPQNDKRESPEREKIILFVAVHPVDTISLHLDEEVQEIENALKQTKQREQFKLEVLKPVCLRDIRNALEQHNPQIVHFSGNGIKTEGFAIANDVGEIKLVTTDNLKKLFSNFTTIQCVVLNISFSEEQLNAIVRHINYVIYLKAIDQKTAIEFNKAFYARRVAGRAIEESYNYGCDSINLYQNIQKNLIPVIKKKTKLENLTKYRTEATKTIILHYAKNYDQLSQIRRDTLEQWRSNLQILPEEAFEINNNIFKLVNDFELDIKDKIKDCKKHINNTNINELLQFGKELSYFQSSLGLGEEAIDKTGTRVGDEIISIIYVEVAGDLLCQKDLNKAKVFLEEAAKLDKNNLLVYTNFASIYLEEEKYNNALVELNTAKRLFVQKKMLEDAKNIDSVISQIPISSRIVHLISTVLQMCVKLSKRMFEKS